MSENIPEKQIRSVNRIYHCPECKKTHNITLDREAVEEQTSFPFPYVYLHSSAGELKDLLTTLYLDADLQIRGVEVVKLENSDIFSEDLTLQITEQLTNEIFELQSENLQLKEENERLQSLFEKLNLEKIKKVSVKEEMIPLLFTSIVGLEEVEMNINIHPSKEIQEIKEDISKKFNLIPGMFHLSYEGILLDSDKTIKNYDISSESNIIIIPNSNAG